MSADAMPREVEVKLEALSADVLGRLAKLRSLGPFRLRARGAAQLYTVYVDTADYALARAGVALRLRRCNGTEWEATAKWGGRIEGALHDRNELTVPLSDGAPKSFELPEGPLRDELGCVVLGRRLRPILVSEVHRVLRDLHRGAAKDGGDALAEVALDTVTLHAPDGRQLLPTYYEVEIESRPAGTPADLEAVGGLLQSRFGLVPSRASKFARGMIELAPRMRRLPAAPLDAAEPVATALRKIIAAQLQRVRGEDPGTRRGRDPEPLHRERVAIRRLRAALRAFSGALTPRLRSTLRDELRWLGGELGSVRDVDVQLANLARRSERLDSDTRARLQPFRRHLEAERRQRRARLRATMESRRYNGALLALERFATSPAPQRPRGEAAQPIARAARRIIKRTVRKLLRKGGAVGEFPNPQDLHALRIAAKRLRYLLDAVEPLTGKPGRKLNRELTRLQDVLGAFHDAIVATGFVRTYRDAQVTSTDMELRRTLTEIADGELRRAGAAQAEFARAWRQFTAKTRRRHRRKLLKQLGNGSRRATAAAVEATGAAEPG